MAPVLTLIRLPAGGPSGYDIVSLLLLFVVQPVGGENWGGENGSIHLKNIF
jgi:hypothetical protein